MILTCDLKCRILQNFTKTRLLNAVQSSQIVDNTLRDVVDNFARLRFLTCFLVIVLQNANKLSFK